MFPTLLLFVFGVATASTARPTPQNRHHKLPQVISLDCDNTLYRTPTVEKEIVRRLHKYCFKEYNLSPGDADKLHDTYGSTIHGLMITTTLSPSDLASFYSTVYSLPPSIYSDLLPPLTTTSSSSSTGYTPPPSPVPRLLAALSSSPLYSLHIASNSPKSHISSVVSHLGLSNLKFSSILFPSPSNDYLTKSSPSFYDPLPPSTSPPILIDDSPSILDIASSHPSLPQTYLVSHPPDTLHRSLLLATSSIDPDFEFDPSLYLKSKNVIDEAAINPTTYNLLRSSLLSLLPPFNTHLKVADLGCGLLHMLRRLIDPVNGIFPPFSSSSSIQSLEYHAFESNPILLPEILSSLTKMGFTTVSSSPPYTFFKEFSHLPPTPPRSFFSKLFFSSLPSPPPSNSSSTTTSSVTVHLHMHDYRSPPPSLPPPSLDNVHLIVGSCFADLFDPDDLARDLKLLSKNSDTLLYFPITYNGMTLLSPSSPPSPSLSIPSDTHAMKMYNSALTDDLNHNLDPTKITHSLTRFGAKILSQSTSVWRINKKLHLYMHDCMLYFFGSATSSLFIEKGYNMKNFIERIHSQEKDITVWNTDILARFENPSDDFEPPLPAPHEIQFTAPYRVTHSPLPPPSPPLPDEVTISPICSLISSGTELKIFANKIDNTDAPLDTTIESMSSSSFSYPLTYGYCLVGTVTDAGSSSQHLLNATVFSFSPHSTSVTAKASSVIVVPPGIDPYKAIFLPSVETAISLIHDAEVLPGEKVGVVGQGLIGLLVTAILHCQRFDVTSFEMIDERQALSAFLGADIVLSPKSKEFDNDLDVSIEVSGVGAGLQTAIDRTGDGGRIVIGSLYPKDKVSLRLGMDFHRSKKKMMVSQVSTLPAKLQQRWTKERRFNLAWKLIEELPLERLLGKVVGLDQAQEAYESLSKGEESIIAFDLRKPLDDK